ncbi:MAG: glycoside hydrolase family 28 protein [Eubacteriales bacterium]|nr:glycoside hydrolase family 28 protein [Eubacteriales bacterium]
MKQIPEPDIPDRRVAAPDYPTLQQAVDACAQAGGGTVEVPAGTWHTGPIHLRSHIRLLLEEGAELIFSDQPEDYLPVVLTRWEGTECYNYSPLIYARDCSDVALCGSGTLCGSGPAWWHWKQLQAKGSNALYDASAAGVPIEQRVYGTEAAALRPSFVQFFDCERVLVEGVTLLDGPQWTLHPVFCRDVTIRGVHIHTEGPNTDGLNPDSCRNVLIEDSSFFTGDDCIAVNSGLNEDGWRRAVPCENVVIRRCSMTGGHGGLVVGSAISGGARNIFACDCDITGTMQGLRLKSMRGRGGYVENVRFENIRIGKVSHEAIQINMFYEFSTVMPKTDRPSRFHGISFSGISCEGAQTGIAMKGLPEQPLRDISFRDVSLTAKNAMTCFDTEELTFERVTIRPQEEEKR